MQLCVVALAYSITICILCYVQQQTQDIEAHGVVLTNEGAVSLPTPRYIENVQVEYWGLYALLVYHEYSCRCSVN